MTSQQYDVAIIGSGIAGSTLAAILAKQGKRVLVFEAKEHPRFAIGESMILETSEMMRALADFYDVPEIAYFSSENFRRKAGTSHGVKRHFGFWHHNEGAWHDPQHTLQAVIPKEPHGHEFHLYRQDCDYYMMMCAIKYGATVRQNTRVADVEMGADGVTIVDDRGERFSAEFLVDAAGFRSIIADKFKLRTRNQQTHSRGIFTHMINVSTVPQEENDLPFPMSEGTLHHVFDGGWLWVIPFNNFDGATNPVTSVGLLLDPEKYPQNNDLTPEEEFYDFIKRFPSIHAQLLTATPIRDWVRAPRIQYGSTQVVGDRWALLGHAAGFIDPLYSKGLYISMASVFVLADQLLGVRSSADYQRNTFLPLEEMTQNFLRRNDRLVANSYKSWGSYPLWQNYSVLWLLGAYTELIKLNTMRSMAHDNRAAYAAQLVQMQLHGGAYNEFFRIADRIDQIIENTDIADPIAVNAADQEIRTIFEAVEWMPGPFEALLEGATSLPRKKIRPDLIFKRNGGFLGKGRYREHFFGNHSLWELVKGFSAEKIRYSPLAIRFGRL